MDYNPVFKNMNNMCDMYNMNNWNNINNMNNWNNMNNMNKMNNINNNMNNWNNKNNMNNMNNMNNINDMNNINNMNNWNNMNNMNNIFWLNNIIGMISNINKNDFKNYKEIIKKLDKIIQQKEFEIYCLNQSKMSIMNLMNNINPNKLIRKYDSLEQNQSDNNLILKFIKKNSYKIDVQCLRNQTIQEAINSFCCKVVDNKNSFIFYYKKKPINIDKSITIGELGINNNDEIIVVKKEDLNNNNKLELFDEIKSSDDDDDSSEEKQDTEIQNQNNYIKKQKISIVFDTHKGNRLIMDLDVNESVGNALKKYLKKMKVNTNNESIYFLHNGSEIKSSDNNKTIGEYFGPCPKILVVDTTNIIGA